MRTGGLLVVGLFVVLGSVTACQSGTSTATGGASGVVSTVGSAPVPPSVTSSQPPVTSIPVTPTVGTPPTVARPPTVVPPPSGPRKAVPPSEINSGGMVNPPQGVQVSSDGRYIVFLAEQSGCQQITAQATDQTPTQVTIVVTTSSTRKANQMCPMIVREVTVVAQLSAPLNGRTIVFRGVRHG